MSDTLLKIQRQTQALQDQLERLRKADVPALYLPFVQERLIPFPLASSGTALGYFSQPWAMSILAFYVSVYVATTNDGSNYWTIILQDSPLNTLASVNTSAITANAAFRLSDTSVTAPVAASPFLQITATATGSPGSIYIIPAVAILRTG